MEERRAGAAQIAIQNNLGPDAASSNVVQNEDPTQRLMQLKSMLDAGVISQAEFEDKRQEILRDL